MGNKNSLRALPKSEIPILSLILIKNLGVRIIRVRQIHHSQNLQVWIHCRSKPSRFGMAREHVEGIWTRCRSLDFTNLTFHDLIMEIV
jgi:hypothetical protein